MRCMRDTREERTSAGISRGPIPLEYRSPVVEPNRAKRPLILILVGVFGIVYGVHCVVGNLIYEFFLEFVRSGGWGNAWVYDVGFSIIAAVWVIVFGIRLLAAGDGRDSGPGGMVKTYVAAKVVAMTVLLACIAGARRQAGPIEAESLESEAGFLLAGVTYPAFLWFALRVEAMAIHRRGQVPGEPQA